MTVEEALVALLAAVAGILLFVGLSQALEARPRRDVDEPRAPRLAPPRGSSAAAPSPPTDLTDAPTERPPGTA